MGLPTKTGNKINKMWNKQSNSTGEKLPAWDWKANPELECVYVQTRKGAGKGSDYTFHDVEEFTTKEKYSLLGNTVLDGIFDPNSKEPVKPGDRIKIDFKGKIKGQNGRDYNAFEWFKWSDDLPPIESI